MSGRAFALASLPLSTRVFASLLVAVALTARARAEPMDLTLSRLSVGECSATAGGEGLRLMTAGEPTLRPDMRAFREVAAQLAATLAPTHTEPVITSGPAGFDLSLETGVTSIDASEAWARASRGEGGTSCAARNDEVRPLLVAERIRVQKGLPLGFSLAATVGKLFATSLYSVGVDMKFALLEEVLESRIPDLALRLAVSKPVGADDYSLLNVAFDVLLSEQFVIARIVTLSPYLGAGTLWTRVRTSTIDLTPNIDALACSQGRDAVCNAAGLGASSDDLAHEVAFSTFGLLRVRGFAGFALRYRGVSLSAAGLIDVLEPHLGAGDAKGARQWTLSFTPAMSF